MPLTAAAFPKLVRALASSLTPGEDAAAVVGGYLAAAYAQLAAVPAAAMDAAVRDAAAGWWAAYQVWDDIATRMTTTPASVTLVDQGSRAYTAEQVRQAVANRDGALARYNALVPAVAEAPGTNVGAGGGAGVRASTATPITFVY